MSLSAQSGQGWIGGGSWCAPPTWQPCTPAQTSKAFADELHDFDDTAALLECLDWVISVDTSVAHLAGALGKPVWVLLPFVPDWRWLLDRDTSPWYPQAVLYRQSAIDDWDTVLARLGGDLRLRVPSSES